MWLTCLGYCSVLAGIPWGLVANVVCWVCLHVYMFLLYGSNMVSVVVLELSILASMRLCVVCVFVCPRCGVNVTFQVLFSLTGNKHAFHDFCLELFGVCLLSTAGKAVRSPRQVSVWKSESSLTGEVGSSLYRGIVCAVQSSAISYQRVPSKLRRRHMFPKRTYWIF